MKKNPNIRPATPSLKQYLSAKGFGNYAVPTAVICLVIYALITKEPMPFINVAGDLLLPVFITVLICALTLVPGIKGDLKKGKAAWTDVDKATHPVYRKIPKSLVGQAIGFAVLATLIFAMIPGGILAAIATMSGNTDLAIGKTAYWILKGIYSGVFINFTMRWATNNTLAQFQQSFGSKVY